MVTEYRRLHCTFDKVWVSLRFIVSMRLLLLLCLCASAAHGEVVRLALVVGNNAGGGDVPPLRYAENDAGKVARLLEELGEVPPAQLVLLQGQTPEALERAVERLRGMALSAKQRQPDAKVALLFYFSGHSDGEGLELGPQLVPFSRLKALLAGTSAEVRLLIVDACRSGAALQQKGAKAKEAFSIRMNNSLDATGEAFIASSAADEAALESNEVMGSIFTHHLVSGLRGAADSSGDRLVTLGEAYRYAYDQTVTRTSMLAAGGQHPSYEYKLSGQGEWVLTSLRQLTGALVLPKDTERAVITDVLRDQIIAEVPRGVQQVALAPGSYGVRVFREGIGYGGRVVVPEGVPLKVSFEQLERLSVATPVARKGAFGEVNADWRSTRVLSVAGGVGLSVGEVGVVPSVRVGFEPLGGPGFCFALVGAYTQQSVIAEFSIEGRVGWRYGWVWGPVWLGVGAEVGPGWVLQSSGDSSRSSVTGTAAPRLASRLSLGPNVALTIEAEMGLLVGAGASGVVLRPRPSLVGGLALRW
jgi:hypothetical protein